jgi:hypothetical protein
VGGPNILKHPKDTSVAEAMDSVLSTYLGSGGSPQFMKIRKEREVYVTPGCNLGIARSLYDLLGGFDERLRYNEDSDICRRARESGYRVTYVPEAKVDHYMGIDSYPSLVALLSKYGVERGKNVARSRRLLAPFNLLSIAYLLVILATAILSLVTAWGWMLLTTSILGALVLELAVAVYVGLARRSILMIPFAFLLLLTIHLVYNAAFLRGYALGT